MDIISVRFRFDSQYSHAGSPGHQTHYPAALRASQSSPWPSASAEQGAPIEDRAQQKPPGNYNQQSSLNATLFSLPKKPKTQENVFHLMFLLWVHISNIITVLRTNKDFRISELFLYKN